MTTIRAPAAVVTAFAVNAAAAGYPVKPIRLIAAQPAGGNTDVVARLFSQQLAERFGRQIVVDNRGGTGGIIATELVARVVLGFFRIAWRDALLFRGLNGG